MSKNVDEAKACSVCGTALSVVDESCPVCMLRKGLAGGVQSGESSASEDIVGPTPEPASRRFENYEIVKGEDGIPVELGRGAMGITYKAFDVDLRCLVTLKVITARYLHDESARLRFLREARAAASVRHPNVASVFHLGRTGENYFYAMEFVEGETLESLIQRSGSLEVKLALEISAQVAAGLAAVHEQKLVHRDIKPSNIMVSLKDGNRVTAKIIDLGLSKAVTESPSQSAISMPGAFAGTPEFASPEQFAGVGVDIRSDLYSFGVTLWQMLTGKLPFHGTPAEVMYQHQHASLPLEQLIDVPQPIVVLLQVLLEKDPKWRFQSPTELLNAMAKVTVAITARRSVTHQYLRKVTDEQLAIGSKTISAFSRLITAIGSPNARRVLWAALALLVAGGLITIISTFLRASHRISDASITALSVTKTPEKSIAVLPFESLSDNKSDNYFADGVQDEILSNLAKASQLKVISRTSVMTYRSTMNRDLRSIANALGVANVVEGTVRRDGNRIRVTTELVDAQTDQTLWSDSYDRDLTDIFAIQSEVAQTIARKLTATLSADEKKLIEAKPTENLDAYDLYLQAKELILRAYLSSSVGPSETLLTASVGLLERAIQLDPNFVLAYCTYVEAQGLLCLWYDPTPARRSLAETAVKSALRLQPDLPEAHLAYARYLYFAHRSYEPARAELAIARRALVNNSELLILVAYIDAREGKFDDAIQEFNQAVALDPRNKHSLVGLADTLWLVRQFRAAEEAYGRLIELVPDQPMFKLDRASNVTFMETGNDAEFWSAVGELPESMNQEKGVLSLRLRFALADRDWRQTKELIEKFNGGEDNGDFAYGPLPVPIGCYSILLSRVRGDQLASPAFFETRKQLDQNVHKLEGNALLLSNLAIVDALLGNKEEAILEARRASEVSPVSKDAVDGASILVNLAVVYAWTNELDLAFQTLDPLAKAANGIYYGQLLREPYWDPLRNDPRFDKVLAALAPHNYPLFGEISLGCVGNSVPLSPCERASSVKRNKTTLMKSGGSFTIPTSPERMLTFRFRIKTPLTLSVTSHAALEGGLHGDERFAPVACSLSACSSDCGLDCFTVYRLCGVISNPGNRSAVERPLWS